MKKMFSILFAVLAFTLKLIVMFAGVIIGIDLYNRYMDDKNHKRTAKNTD